MGLTNSLIQQKAPEPAKAPVTTVKPPCPVQAVHAISACTASNDGYYIKPPEMQMMPNLQGQGWYNLTPQQQDNLNHEKQVWATPLDFT